MSNWEWGPSGLYDGDVEILWVTQDRTGTLYLGVMADYEDAIREVPDLLAACEAGLDAYVELREAGHQTDDGWYVGNDALIGIRDAIDAMRAAIARAKGDDDATR